MRAGVLRLLVPTLLLLGVAFLLPGVAFAAGEGDKWGTGVVAKLGGE